MSGRFKSISKYFVEPCMKFFLPLNLPSTYRMRLKRCSASSALSVYVHTLRPQRPFSFGLCYSWMLPETTMWGNWYRKLEDERPRGAEPGCPDDSRAQNTSHESMKKFWNNLDHLCCVSHFSSLLSAIQKSLLQALFYINCKANKFSVNNFNCSFCRSSNYSFLWWNFYQLISIGIITVFHICCVKCQLFSEVMGWVFILLERRIISCLLSELEKHLCLC